jgi:NADH:ubiquinone oxidoreductase subunit 3 (subunit A)
MTKGLDGYFFVVILFGVLTLPRVLLFPIAEKVNKKATAAPSAIKVCGWASW